MAQNLLQLSITNVSSPVFEGEVISVTVPGVAGEMQLLANHEALISPLKEGTITIVKEDNSKEEFAISSGTLEISNNHATVLI